MSPVFHVIYTILWPIVHLLWPMKVCGRENLISGPYIMCANHSALIDPVLLVFAVRRKNMVHFMAKDELSHIPVLSWILKKCGVFFVKRGESDIDAIRTAMRYLKAGKRIMMFPEGTRVSSEDGGAAKRGAVSLASRLGVPIIPVNIPRHKKLFHRTEIHIGQAYTIERCSRDELEQQSEALMHRIEALGEVRA